MRKPFVILFILLFAMVVACVSQPPSPKAAAAKEKVGVYDSRAIILAYFGTPHFIAWMDELMARYQKAKTDGNEEAMKAANAEGEARQRKLHTQAFSTAPVDDALEAIKDQLPGIAKQAGVGPIISKWDKASLAKHAGAEQVDITMALVEAFHPIERQRKIIPEVLKTEPLPLEEVEKMPVDD